MELKNLNLKVDILIACYCFTNNEYTRDGANILLYTCCRDGKAKENHCPKKTTQTRNGSRKLEEYCLSRITVRKEKNGKLSAHYICTHTNHTPGITEAKHIPLPSAVKEEVRKKYGQDIKLDSILDGRLPSYLTCNHGQVMYMRNLSKQGKLRQLSLWGNKGQLHH